MRPDLKRKLGYSDYAALPDDGNRYEILDGDLYVTPAPTPMHQRVSRRLQRQMEDYFHERTLGEVFNAPIDVILASGDIVQPDLVVVADAKQVSDRAIEGAPLLVVEVLSPSTRGKDRGIKARRYARLGVRHYWIVDPESRRIECGRLAEEEYQPVTTAEGDVPLTHPDWDGLRIDSSILWR